MKGGELTTYQIKDRDLVRSNRETKPAKIAFTACRSRKRGRSSSGDTESFRGGHRQGCRLTQRIP